jgi:molecular chaperone GrpE (heat shock protein)
MTAIKPQEADVSKSFKEWLAEGDNLYNAAMNEFQTLETQIEELEAKLAQKKEEVNQIAQVVGKPPVEGNRKPAVQIVDSHGPGSIPSSRNTIAKALTGRGLG